MVRSTDRTSDNRAVPAGVIRRDPLSLLRTDTWQMQAFALLLEKAAPEQIRRLNDFEERVFLPSDLREGIRFFPSVQVLLMGKGNWRATITCYDVEYCKWGHPTGGTVSLLWHREYGPVLIGTMGEYELRFGMC